MAKNESTAVNALIEQVAIGRNLHADEDLMFAPPKPKLSAPRVSGTVPPTRGAGEVAPLPRGRAPHGTQRSLPPLHEDPNVRAPRPNSIPPIAAPPTGSGPQRVVHPPGQHPMATVPQSRLSQSPGRAMNAMPVMPKPTPQTMPAMPAASASLSMASRLPLQSPPSIPPGGYTLPQHAGASSSAPTYLPPGTSDSWFVTSNSATHEHKRDSFGSFEGTIQVQRASSANASLVGKLVGPMICLAIAGVFVGGYFAFDGQGNKTKAPKTAAAVVGSDSETSATMPTPAAAASNDDASKPETALARPDVAAQQADDTAADKPEAAVAKEAPAEAAVARVNPTNPSSLVDVRIDSKPSGATVMLVDRGKTTFLGTTPLDAALDPAHKVELVFTHGDRPTRVEPLDPSSQKRVAVVLAPVGAKAEPAVKAEPAAATKVVEAPKAESAADKARAERKAARKAAREAKASEKPAKASAGVDASFLDKAEKPAAKAVKQDAVTGEGVLMISSKPPCEIYVDGKSTGLTTPQRAIKLPAGSHKITLVNAESNIKKTIAVQISADKPTKVIQDLMK